MPPRRKKEPRMTAEKTYLIVYNSLALLASEYLILRAWNCDVSPQNLYAILDAVTVLQSFMVLEILHAALRDVLTVPGKQLICKAHYYSLTVLRIGGRHFIIWFVMRQFTLLIFKYAGTTFLACLLCWGCFDFLYYARAIELLLWGNASSLFVWLRYSISATLYLASLIIEALLVFIILDKNQNISSSYMAYISLGLLMYLIASHILFMDIVLKEHKTSRLRVW